MSWPAAPSQRHDYEELTFAIIEATQLVKGLPLEEVTANAGLVSSAALLRLSISSYSFHHRKPDAYPVV